MDAQRRDDEGAPEAPEPSRPGTLRTARPGGFAIGDTCAYEDGLRIRVGRLGLLPKVPPKSFLEEESAYVTAEAIRFEVTITNDGEETASVSELDIRVRSGVDGRPGEETWSGTKTLRGKLLPGASATGTYTYQVLAGTVDEIDIAIARGHYRSDEETQRTWTGAAAPGLYDADQPGGEGTLTQEMRDKLFAEAVGELDTMTGLVQVKRRVRMLSAQARMAAVRARLGLPASIVRQHLVFAGPPGTGKTMVARLLGKVLAGVGALDRGHLVEANRVDLIGEHVGQTAVKTNQLIDRALDGVLFIDEAYGLYGGYPGNADAFGNEAIQALLKRAEDDRGRLVVILAGYGAEMTRLLRSNPGLASRFATRVNFPSYDSGELLAIARGFLAGTAEELDAAAEKELGRICALVDACGWQDALGNGRFARVLVENARAVRDLRLAEQYGTSDPPATELMALTASDIAEAFADLRDGHRLGRGTRRSA